MDSKYEDIVQASIRLFARQGIEGTSVKEIGREAGVTDAAIYKHFNSKDEVAVAVFAHYASLYTRLVDSRAQMQAPFGSRLDSLVLDILTQHDKDRFGLLLLGQRHEIFSRLSATQRLPVAAVTDFIQAGIDSGDLPPQSARLTAALLIGAFMRLAVFSDLGAVPAFLGGLADEIQARVRGLTGVGQPLFFQQS